MSTNGGPPTVQYALSVAQQLFEQGQYAQAESLARQLKQQLPEDLIVLSMLDQALYGLDKPQSELDELKEEIVQIWQTKHRSTWEAAGRPKKWSSWARARGDSNNYHISVSEYYIPETLGDSDITRLTAYFKVLAFPKEEINATTRQQNLPRIFKVETSAVVRQLGAAKPYLLREYFFTGGGGTTGYCFSEDDMNCKNIMRAVIAFLNSYQNHQAATTIPGVGVSTPQQTGST